MLKITDNIYLFDYKTKTLLYNNKEENYLIDPGHSPRAMKEMEEYFAKEKGKLNGIINTHNHFDHTLNNYITEKYPCPIYANKSECIFIKHSDIAMCFIYGGAYPKDMMNSRLANKASNAIQLVPIKNIKYIDLPGHTLDMIGVLIEDKVLYVGDAIFNDNELKYYPYFYDITKFLESMEVLKSYKDKIIISSHSGIIENLDEMIEHNKKYIQKVSDVIESFCRKRRTFDEIFAKMCRRKFIPINETFYYPIASTIKSFLAYLVDNNRLKVIYKNSNRYYKKVSKNAK